LRIALFGGTFDPPHLGHLVVADWARDRLGLDRVVFMPAGHPPHKSRPDLLPAPRRVALTRLAVRGWPGFQVSTAEASRPGPSFTVDTLRVLRARWPRAALYFIVGEDSLRELDTWRDPGSVLRLATPVVARRPSAGPGLPRPLRRIARRLRAVVLDNPPLGISSSLVRARARAGRSIRFLVPGPVERAIRRLRLYRPARRSRR
jgi:nicotinate-nucleotide adenylyltransferase